MRKFTFYKLFFYQVLVLLCLIPFKGLYGQSPGGVTLTQELWLKADQPQSGGLLADGQSVTLWQDLSGQGRDHVQNTTNAVPVFKRSGDLMNFQPALSFTTGLGTNTKLIGPDYGVQTTKSYYVFYVSKFDGTAVASLYSFNASRNNNNGWNAAGNPYFSTGNTTANANTNNSGKKYGINTVIRPNVTNLSQISYFNGIPQSFTGRAMAVTTGQSVIGNSNTTTTYPFYGDVQEIIILSSPNNEYMSDGDLEKVHSYLSIKYGISLEKGTSLSFPSYVNSNGDIIWNGGNNVTYQNHVFGIGKDVNSGLDQKQSTNYDKSTVTVFVGNSLADLNVNNTGTLVNNTFLMFGSNDVDGVVGYGYDTGQLFANGSITGKVNFRQNRILLAQTFGQTSFTVNMKVHVDAKYVLVCPDENFNPSNTRIYEVVNDIAEGVEVNNGEYVSFASAQANPGGTELLTELWLRADDIATAVADSTAITTWTDASSYGRDHVKSGTVATPVIRNEKGLMNYHAHLQFTTTSLLAGTSFMQSDKSYYVFYVSEIDATGTQALYALNDNQNNHQGWSAGSPYFTDGGTASSYVHTHSNPQGKMYGIVAVERPNSTTTQQRITFNGTSESFAGRAIVNPTTGGSLVGNRRTGGTYDRFLGNAQEIIVLSGAQDAQMSAVDLQKVNSYLAIKYGISLDKTSQPDYIDSYGTTVWNGATNDGYQNNIFGIGRDDNSGLYQKQSISYDRNIMTVFVGNELADLNIDNEGSLSNGEFLMFGSNGLDDYLDFYDYLKDTQFANGGLPSDVNYKNQVVLKAQTTGKSRFVVNVQPSVGAKVILVSPDGAFAPATTRVYLVENKVAKDVEIDNGDYIGFAVYENAPGGVVNGLRLWLRADDSSSVQLDEGTNNVVIWKDQTSNENDYNYSLVNNNSKVPPVYTACDSRMNFFPSLYFAADASLAIKSGPMSTDKPLNSTSFVVYNSIGYTSGTRTYTHGFGGVTPTSAVTRHPAVGFAPSGGQGRVATTAVLYNGTVKGFSLGATALHMVRLRTYNAPGGRLIEHDFGGLSDQMVPSGTTFGNEFLMASGGTLGSASISTGQFDGLMSEIFFYERELNDEEKARIRTYLGIKYAITLYAVGSTDTNKLPFDYVLSDVNKTTVWKGTTAPYSGYHKNVTGLVRDDNSNLYVNKARSTDVEAVVTMQAGESTECGQGDSPALVNDLSGLFWGNNGATGTTVYDPDAKAVCGDLESRMNRIWLVNKTNLEKQQVTISAGNSTVFPYNTQYKVYLLIANSAEDIANDNWAQAIPGEWVDGQVQFNYTFSNDNTYFTFAGVQVPGTCTACAFSGYKDLDLSKVWAGSANRGQLNKTVDLGDGFSANIAVTDPGNVLRSGYPRNNGKTLELRRRGNRNTDTQPITTTITYTGGAAATSFELYDIDGQSMSSDDVEVYGLCGGGMVKPKLTYVAAQNRSSYLITDNKANGKVSGSYSSSSYSATRGRVFVDFSVAVEQIVIVYNAKYNTSSTRTQTIGIGPLSLYCPKPVVINEDGLGFTLQGPPAAVLTCDEVPLTFRIENTNCDDKIVSLDNVLPSGMVWVKESLFVEDEPGSLVSNEYGDTTQLSVQGIVAKGASTTTVTIRAKFTEDVTATYTTRASIAYTDIFGDPATYESCDLMDGCGVTTINSIQSGMPAPVTVDKITTSSSCISDNGTITVNIQVTNPNGTLDHVTLSAGMTEGFNYVDGSLTSTFDPIGGTIFSEEGELIVEDFDLPTGTNTISFKVKAPTVLPTDITEFEINLDMVTSSTMDCAKIDTSGADLDPVISFCTYCTQDPNTDPATEMSRVGISSQRSASGWVEVIPNGFIVLESKDKGFVITRTTTANIPADQLVEGMLIYDTTDECIKLYNGTDWKCVERSCNE